MRNWIALFLSLVSGAALAEPVHTPHVTAELVSEYATAKAGETVMIGLRLEMEKHWHTYWRFPGDSGLPTKVKWELPGGWKISEPLWPTPSRIQLPPLVNFGYDGETLIGFELSVPASATGDQVIKGKATWLVCKEECIPGGADLTLNLKVGEPKKNSWNHFDRLRRQQPQPLPPGAFTATKIEGKRIGIELDNDPVWLGAKVDFFPLEAQTITGMEPPKVEKSGGTATLWMEKSEPFSTTAKSLRGILISGDAVYEVDAPLAAGAAPAAGAVAPSAPDEDAPGVLLAALFAFLGGILLNLMPCVFPVLGIKVMGLVAQGGGDPWHSRKHGKVYALGVLVSFWLLTALLLGLRSAGQSVGWGFQLQHPSFVVAMIFLFSILCANLAGFIEFGGRLMGVGSNLASREGYSGSFFTGMLAVVVATPCTAPFMGTAIGVVLGQPAWAVFLVFTALALGLAAPFVVLSYQPRLVKALPRPGAWMERLKEFFAFPLAATVIWLFWVLALQIGVNGLLYVAIALLLYFAFIWARKRFRHPVVRTAAWLLFGIAFLCVMSGLKQRASLAAAAEGWQEYSAAKVSAALAEKKPVFIDFTAAWCLTCQVNKAAVLEREGMKDFFRGKGVVLFRADWTNSDPEITKALESHGRIGVPVYAAYAAGSDKAQLLPQILTEDIVKQAFP
jgi:thiol:disulfide interchange protein DsbD